MRRRFGFIAAACVAIAAAAPASAGAATKTVTAGPPGSAQKALLKYSGTANQFFLPTVTIHAGDSIKFLILGFHTIDLPGKSTSDLPILVRGGTVTGDKDAAGKLFWFNGKPKIFVNPALLGPSGPTTYDGTKRSDSGLGGKKPYVVSFTKPGKYKYFCDVHRGMVGFVVVKAKGKKIPTAKQDKATLAKLVKKDLATAKKLSTTTVKANNVSLGAAAKNGVEDYAMFPAKMTVKAGTVVTFSLAKKSRDFHSATFGPKAYVAGLNKSLNGPSPLEQAFYPSDNPALGPAAVTPTSHGNGFASTGFLLRDPAVALPVSGKLKFTKKGTFKYYCVVHLFMVGTITVK